MAQAQSQEGSINDFLKVDGIYYQEDDRDIKLGRQSGHRLFNNRVSFGELAFKRSKCFRENELQQIESIVILLLIPIGNALNYADAVAQAISEPAIKITGLTWPAYRSRFWKALETRRA